GTSSGCTRRAMIHIPTANTAILGQFGRPVYRIRKAMAAFSADDGASFGGPLNYVLLQAQGPVQSPDSTLVAVSALFAVPAGLRVGSLLQYHSARSKV